MIINFFNSSYSLQCLTDCPPWYDPLEGCVQSRQTRRISPHHTPAASGWRRVFCCHHLSACTLIQFYLFKICVSVVLSEAEGCLDFSNLDIKREGFWFCISLLVDTDFSSVFRESRSKPRGLPLRLSSLYYQFAC